MTAPDPVLAVPTMLSERELALLYWLARDYASGTGALVDAGCFLGGSSAALLAGLADREQPWSGPLVASYDRFEVEPYTVARYFADADVAIGDSFRPFYDRNVAPFRAAHEVHEGDIVEEGWDGGPIEVLFLDVLKSWQVNDAVVRDFFPDVIPGRTVLVHQDYMYGMVPWLHISVELMRGSLRLLDEIPWGSHVFLVEHPIDPSLFGMRLKEDLADAEKLALMDRAIAANRGVAREMVTLSKAWLLYELGDAERGRALVRDLASRTSSLPVQNCAHVTLGYMGVEPHE